MNDFESIDFTAISSPLGLDEPLPHSDITATDLEPPPFKTKHHVTAPVRTSPPKKQNKFLGFLISSISNLSAFMLDHISIGLFFILLCAVPYFLLGLPQNISLYAFIFHPGQELILIVYGALLLITYSFYYLFFKQFKTPTLGKLIIFGTK